MSLVDPVAHSSVRLVNVPRRSQKGEAGQAAQVCPISKVVDVADASRFHQRNLHHRLDARVCQSPRCDARRLRW